MARFKIYGSICKVVSSSLLLKISTKTKSSLDLQPRKSLPIIDRKSRAYGIGRSSTLFSKLVEQDVTDIVEVRYCGTLYKNQTVTKQNEPHYTKPTESSVLMSRARQ